MTRSRPIPPHPELQRRPSRSFGWLETSYLHDGTLAGLGPQAIAVLLLLVLAADEKGASYYGRGKMGAILGMDMESVTVALRLLLNREIVAFRPWRRGSKDGVWQLLPVRMGKESKSQPGCLPIGEILNRLGLGKDRAGG